MPLRVGDTFAGYRILRLLGSGGMGEVYLVQHPRLPRHDALKVLRPDASSDTSFRERFIREADLAAGLRHPHIVGIHDRGEHDGHLWIAMDYIDGSDAAQLIQKRYPAGMPAELSRSTDPRYSLGFTPSGPFRFGIPSQCGNNIDVGRGCCVGQTKLGYSPNMGSREAADLYFGTRVRAERERRGWSQEELAKRLTDKGIPVYASTIAKIESEKKPRAARLGEAAGIADLFGVSLDSLLGRHTGPQSDLVFALRGLTDAARQSSAELMVVVGVLRRRLEDLAAFEFDGSDLVLAQTIRAVNGLTEAAQALWEIAAFELPSGANVRLRGDLVERAATGKT